MPKAGFAAGDLTRHALDQIGLAYDFKIVRATEEGYFVRQTELQEKHQ